MVIDTMGDMAVKFMNIKWAANGWSSKSTEAKQLSRQGIEQNLPPKQTRRPLPWLLSPSFSMINGHHEYPTAHSINIMFRPGNGNSVCQHNDGDYLLTID